VKSVTVAYIYNIRQYDAQIASILTSKQAKYYNKQ
jgi:hypothetical protein